MEIIIFIEPIENIHKDQILKYSKIPAEIGSDIYKKAHENAKINCYQIRLRGYDVCRIFYRPRRNLLVNEIAPRVHNSGHLTINAFSVSQFENHISRSMRT